MERSLLLVAVLVYQAQCFSDRDLKGNGVKIMCNDLRPSYEPFEAGNRHFVVKSTLVSELDGKYTPGEQYSLDLIGLVNPYEGFIIQATDRWNKGLILGSFIPLDTSKAQTILCHGNEHGTVTHKTKDPVSVQSFIWQAPPTLEGSGEVDFVYSVLQSFHHWIGPYNMGQRRHTKAVTHDMPMNSTNSSDESTQLHSVMVRVHGVVMTVAFSIFGVIGIFFAAWMKPVLAQNHWWFKLHRGMMIASLFLGTFGFICIFVAHSKEMFNGHYGLVPLNNPRDITHFTFSFIIMVLLITNPIIAIFRCKPDAPRRWIYNLVHGALVGLVFEVLVLANSCLGLILLGGVGSMFYIYLFFSIFTVVMNIALGFVIISSGGGGGDLPAIAKLLRNVLSKSRTLQLPLSPVEGNNGLKDEEDVLLGEKKEYDGAKPSIIAFVPLPTPSAPAPSSMNLLRWGAFYLYVAVSVPLLVVVMVMITMSIPSG